MLSTLLLTFDYEVWLGPDSGDVYPVLLKPTHRLAGILGEYSLSALFFVDTVYLLRLREVASSNKQAADMFDAVISQLRELLLAGHYIYPHLHPHWLDAKYSKHTGTWALLSNRYYRLHDLEQNRQRDLMQASFELLQSICHSVGRHYEIDTYRAGGWCVQPFSSLRPLFSEFGLFHDMSVAPGHYCYSNAWNYDFTDCPEQAAYRFSSDVAICDPNGEFTEWPISIVRYSKREYFWDSLVNKVLWRAGLAKAGEGTGTSAVVTQRGSRFREKMASLDDLHLANVLAYYRMLCAVKHCQFIGHPKAMPAHKLWVFSLLLKLLALSANPETDWLRLRARFCAV